MNRSKPVLLIALAWITFVLPNCLWAKASAPMTLSLESKASESLGDQQRYEVTLSFKPLADAKLVTMIIDVPEGFKLLQGISYWEGQLPPHKNVEKKLLLEGPKSIDGELGFEAVMRFNATNLSAQKVRVQLAASQSVATSSYPKIVYNKSENNGTRRSKRE